MALLPQELVDAIICEVDDVPTLKASCLAGSTFRKESQRNLFQSFELNFRRRDRKRLDGLRTLLGESPHIGSYVVHLTLGHLSDLDTPDVDIFLHTISTSEVRALSVEVSVYERLTYDREAEKCTQVPYYAGDRRIPWLVGRFGFSVAPATP
ncbi:hypothetical protein C8F04DRAFT_527552 [Mycena alexandri]|uniref:Uncharacterized protein n=1 Tax=Mycena alexandri TaxID=1745969 RepID=A0AAD6TFJ1_9AGAR|nr:hypothetical protein C8F04DRAFT_527552 [Mycena alexandri]